MSRHPVGRWERDSACPRRTFSSWFSVDNSAPTLAGALRVPAREPGGATLKFTHILFVVGSSVPVGHAENSPAMNGWVERRRLTPVPEGRLSDSVVPPGLGM